MDFFTSNHDSSNHVPAQQANEFARAIASRPLTMPAPLALSLTPRPPSAPTAASPPALPSPTPAAFDSVAPAALDAWLNDPSTLLLDIRPHAAYASARVPGAVSLSVPSTLLKRPLFPLQRLSAMLPSRSARNRFSAWRTSSRILVYDADAAAIPENSNINGLLRKFKNDGYEGELTWLRGGFQAVWRERKELVDARPLTPETEHDDDDDDNGEATSQGQGQPAILRTRHLPSQAFCLSSTMLHNSTHSNVKRHPMQLKTSLPSSSSAHHPAANPFFDTIRQNVELSHGITERIPLRLPRRVRRRIDDLKSFPWLQRIAQRAGKAPPAVDHPSSDPSSDDSSDEPLPGDSYADTLATQFYRIERAEQDRLMGIMEYHAKQSGPVSDGHTLKATLFPYSITAGVEKGAKNRYRHIWPFEHARVKLQQNADDYVNASYVQPLFTNKRYIATQGPLPATYIDFWTLCWEQNVHVIVMLTREVEGAMVKCGSYWSDQEYGSLRLRLVSTTGVVDSEEPAGFFTAHPSFPPRPSSSHHPSTPRKPHHFHKGDTIKRVFELTHTGYPGAAPRRITHLQYLDWADMNVPDDPRGVLGLIKQVNEAIAENPSGDQVEMKTAGPESGLDATTGIASYALDRPSPVLLHCSAGVGRTGGFIAVDAILDAIQRQIRAKPEPKNEPSPSHLTDVQPTNEDRSLTTTPAAAKRSQQTLASGHVVHVPIADDPFSSDMDMQVDDSDVPPPTEVSEASIDFPHDGMADQYKDTQRWAEKVGVETGYGQDFFENTQRSNPSEPAVGSSRESVGEVSMGPSSGDSSAPPTNMTSSSMQGIQSSSSLATSISDGTPFSKASNLQAMIDHHRERTSSAPAPVGAAKPGLKRGGVPPSLKLGLGQLNANAASSTPALLSLSTLHQDMFVNAPPNSASPKSHSAEESILGSGNPPQGSDDSDENGKSSSKPPRPLHRDGSPMPLGVSADPVWDIVKDMREQRMSLCQSLRQYVFVHLAIIEGTLMVLDEERNAEMGNAAAFASTIDTSRMRDRVVQPKTAPSKFSSHSQMSHSRSSSVSSRRFPSRSPSHRRRKLSSRRQSPSPTESSSRIGIPPLLFQQALSMESGVSTSGVSSVPLHGKRSASPTELLKEGREGEVLLSKRPSMKRKSDAVEDRRGSASETDGSESEVIVVVSTPSASTSSAVLSSGLSSVSPSKVRIV